EGYVLAPGFIDIHTHLREPGYEEKETIATGTAAAAAGGYTAVVCMANTDPIIDEPSVVEFIAKKARQAGMCRVYITAALTRDLEGKVINEYHFLKEAGAVALSDDGRFVTNSQVMRSALEYAGFHKLTVISHCEDSFLASDSQMNEGYTSTRLGLKGSPNAAEEIAVARDIRLAELTGSRLHIAHVSTAGAVDLIKEAKRKGIPVTAEVTPHHLTLDDTLLETFDSSLKVNPPLRGKKDIEALGAGVRDGTIDCISTDHAPHNEIDKQVEFDKAPPGMIGLETAFAQLNTELVAGGDMDLIGLIKLMTVKPADVLGIPGGRLRRGEPADLVIIDPEEEWALEKGLIRSKSRNTPFIGKRFKGRVQGVFLEGNWRSAILRVSS
ncbi:MAG: dihydroorotase, partial [Candidatus Krumholzibacteria bacterium]|nr:dihydroorotase [Candidatus Krumholzibacteria bacterium]